MLTLYHFWRSSASRRVRLGLAEKGLEFGSRASARHPKVAARGASIQARPAFAVARIEPFTAGLG